MDKALQIRSNIMKFEATALFANVKSAIDAERWYYFREARRQGFSYQLGQSISPYRADIHFLYVFRDVITELYLEREAHVGNIGEDMWQMTFASIEGKAQASLLTDNLLALKEKGYYIPNGNENLERQMNFSLGLYGECLMQIVVRFPTDKAPFQCFCEVMDHIDGINSQTPIDFKSIMEKQNASNNHASDDDDIIMFGDWQTWK